MINFVVNPKAGTIKGKKLKKVLEKLETFLNEKNVPHILHKTSHKGHAVTLTKTLIENGATDIIAIGGDGTLHEVLNGFTNFDTCNLGLIPCGTGNDFASEIGLDKDPIKAMDFILNNQPKYTDYMQLSNGLRGINIVGTGLDTAVLERYEKLKKKNKFGYTMSLVKSLFGYKGVEFDAIVDGETSHYKSFIAGVANGTRYGGGIRICPVANVDDGVLDFVAINHVTGLSIVKEFIRLKSGKILQSPRATAKTGKHIQILGLEDQPLNVDGELYEGVPFDITVVSNQLKMYRP